MYVTKRDEEEGSFLLPDQTTVWNAHFWRRYRIANGLRSSLGSPPRRG